MIGYLVFAVVDSWTLFSWYQTSCSSPMFVGTYVVSSNMNKSGTHTCIFTPYRALNLYVFLRNFTGIRSINDSRTTRRLAFQQGIIRQAGNTGRGPRCDTDAGALSANALAFA
ncbi:hypothetical protein SCHPADRAFT_129320 [Schizopora paradoxa]|uniref:Secreted protein n=1 Tax=Schizopora paradoxa TaxID=27342 RepID=A0A0H2S2Z8_9AGAM|nr:hypothetical protein SCHPADRAFT_129320 [Schizopora paradoxa]